MSIKEKIIKYNEIVNTNPQWYRKLPTKEYLEDIEDTLERYFIQETMPDIYPTCWGNILLSWDLPPFYPVFEMSDRHPRGIFYSDYDLNLKPGQVKYFNVYYCWEFLAKLLDLLKDKVFQNLANELLKNPLNEELRVQYGEILMAYDFENEALESYNFCTEKEKAITWMYEMADKHNVPYEDMIRAGHLGIADYYYIQIGSESLRDTFHSQDMLGLFWNNWSIITGIDSPEKQIDTYSTNKTLKWNMPFSCSC